METDLPARFGAAIQAIRRRQGISQENLAARAGIDRAYMGGIERGQRNPSLTMIQRVADGLDLSMTELFRAVERGTATKRR